MQRLIVWGLVALLMPLHLLLRITEPRHVTINRLRRHGRTWQEIANCYGVSTTTARRWSCPAGGV
jgi:hypothetical protein